LIFRPGAKKTVLFLLGALFLATGALGASGWWDSKWKVRRAVTLRGARRSSYAPLVAYVRFRDFGHLKKDASDVRVVNAQGRPVPFKVMFYHPHLYCVVAFEPESTTWRGYVYYGNPKAPAPQSSWQPRSGLFLATYRRKSDRCNNWRQMRETLRLSRSEPDGAGFHPSIFDGYNPFGSSEHFVSEYDGYFYAPRTGTYKFATISDNASFVFIDGKPVTQWPGRHSVHGGVHGEHKGSIWLKAGPHRVQYFHLQFTGTTVAELVWWRPGDKRPRLMTPGDYLPAYEAEVGLQEFHNDPVRLEFSARPIETLEYAGHHYILWRFGNLSGTRASAPIASRWDFGNGLTSNEANPFVWFLHPGDYKVTLRTTFRGGRLRTVSQWIRVADLLQLDGSKKPNAFERAARRMAQYPLGRLSNDDRRAILDIIKYCKMNDALEKVCRSWLDEVFAKGERVPVDVVLELGRILAEVRAKPEEAESLYTKAIGHCRPDNPFAYQLYLALGELRVKRLKKYTEAIAALKEAQKRVKPKNRIYRRRIAIALGDAYRAQLKRTEAKQQYEAAEQLTDRSAADAPLRSSYGLTAEAFLDRGDAAAALEKLNEWAERFPTDKMGGYWSLLMGRCLMRLGRSAEAAEELSLAAKINPFGNYTRDILEHLGYAYSNLGRYDEAVKALRSAADLLDDPVRKRTIEEQIARIEREARRRGGRRR